MNDPKNSPVRVSGVAPVVITPKRNEQINGLLRNFGQRPAEKPVVQDA